MACIVWKANGGQATAEVRVDGILYTLSNGIPTDVPIEHFTAIQNALLALADTASAAAGPREV